MSLSDPPATKTRAHLPQTLPTFMLIGLMAMVRATTLAWTTRAGVCLGGNSLPNTHCLAGKETVGRVV